MSARISSMEYPIFNKDDTSLWMASFTLALRCPDFLFLLFFFFFDDDCLPGAATTGGGPPDFRSWRMVPPGRMK